MSFLRKLSGTAALITISLILLSSHVAALSSGGIGGRPANPDPKNPRTQSIFIFTINRGETKTDTILVSNNSDQRHTIELYAVDGVVTNTGAYTCSQQAEAKTGMGNWIKLAKDTVTLDAGQTQKVDFSLTMPANADVGEHDGCVVFQDKDTSGQTSGSIHITTRQAIRVVATVPGDLHRDITIQSFDVSRKNGQQLYTLNLYNNGNVSADVDATVTVNSLFGNTIYHNGGGYPVLPNQKLNLSFQDPHRPFFGGWYFASGNISYDKRAGKFGTDNASELVQKHTDRKLIFIPPTTAGLAVLIIALLVILGLLAWFVLRKREQKRVLQTGRTYTIKSGDSIQSIADTHNISWKRLASINAIRAPYSLKEGRKIKVPATAKKRSNTK